MLSYLSSFFYSSEEEAKSTESATQTNESSQNFYYLSLLKEENNQWSIHGLWPQYSDNSYPTFCKPVSFDIQQLQYLLPELNKVWYSNRNDNDDFWEYFMKKEFI